MRRKRFWIAVLAAGAMLAIVGCAPVDPGPTFEEVCADRGGIVVADSTTKLLTGVVTGAVVAGNGAVGVGTGVATSPVTLAMSLCVVDGDVVDMDVS